MLKGNLDTEMYKRKDQELGSLISHLKVRLEGQERNQIVHSDFSFKNASLTMTRRKPFDMFVEGLQMEKWYREVYAN